MAPKRKWEQSGSYWKKAKTAIRRSFKPSGEAKHFDSASGIVAFNNTHAVIKLSDISEGSDSTNRIGRRITAHKLELRLSIAETGTETTVRCIVIRCVGKYTGTPSNYLSAWNVPTDADRCYCLYDNIFTLTANDKHQHSIVKTINLHNLKLKYTGSGATDDQEGCLIFMCVANADPANDPTYTGSTRLWFYDQ